MSSEPTETCMFFVDDSNIWIEAQKFAASGNSHIPKLTDADRDPRLRIDVGKLVDTLRKDRSQGSSFLYGSRPPPNDSVWNAFEKFKFQTKIYDRAHGKEKEVDSSMATDLSSEATELRVGAKFDLEVKQKLARTTFVTITGDRDMLPPVKQVLKCNIRVELWAWESGMSNEYLKLSYQDGLLSIHYLNWIFDKISFTNFHSTRTSKEVDPSKAIGLCNFADPEADDLEASVCEQLMQMGRLFYITRSKTGPDMAVEFPNAPDIEAVIFEAREIFKDMLVVLSWPEYASRFSTNPLAMGEISNMYAPLTNGNGQCSAHVTAKEVQEPIEPKAKPPSAMDTEGGRKENEESQSFKDPNDNNGWKMVTRSDPGKSHRRAMRQTQQCPDRVRCRKRGECGYRHSDEERDLFRDNPNQDFGLWKTSKCEIAYCRRGKRCRYAHTQDEAWCFRCRHEGHFIEECQYRS
ncbi:hypothetical protein QQZ08_001216 [Neonectria magnoliae]|uniref:CCHC-type domain-containing protein n=1 Tax=Neonectria magnoliae TaxID=2732573 RepID=A0ABR1IHH0_9HYPO